MKLHLTLLACFIFQLGIAQNHVPKGQSEEKIDAMRVAFITSRVNLSVEQAQKFWPLYNEYSEKRKALRKGHMKKWQQSKGELSEDQAKIHFEKYFKSRQEELETEKAYFEKFAAVLTYRQLSELYDAERAFHKDLMKRLGDFPDGTEKPKK